MKKIEFDDDYIPKAKDILNLKAGGCMNKNSEIIAIGSFLTLLVTLVILALIMTAEHFQWIEINVLGAKTDIQQKKIRESIKNTLNEFPTPEQVEFDNKVIEALRPTIILEEGNDIWYRRNEDGSIVTEDMEKYNQYMAKMKKQVYIVTEKGLKRSKPTIIESFSGQNTGIFEYKEGLNGITVTTKDGTTYTFFEQKDGSWLRQ